MDNQRNTQNYSERYRNTQNFVPGTRLCSCRRRKLPSSSFGMWFEVVHPAWQNIAGNHPFTNKSKSPLVIQIQEALWRKKIRKPLFSRNKERLVWREVKENALVDYEQPLFFHSPSSKTRENRKWPRAWLKGRDRRGTKKRETNTTRKAKENGLSRSSVFGVKTTSYWRMR